MLSEMSEHPVNNRERFGYMESANTTSMGN